MSYKLEIVDLTREACLLSLVDWASWPPLPTLAAIRKQIASWPDNPMVDLTQPVLRAVIYLQTPAGDAVARQSWIGFLKGQGESGGLVWQEGPGLTPPRITISADLDAFCVWEEHGGGTSLSDEFPDLAGMAELDKALHDWAWPYDQAYIACRFVKANMKMDWQRFNDAGMALAARLHALVVDRAVVFYGKAPWDATRPDNEIQLVG